MEQSQTAPKTSKKMEGTQLLVTLSGAEGEIIRVETLDKSGKKHELQDEDFATLVGDDDVGDLLPVLEQAYMAGFSDASEDVFESDDTEGQTDEDGFEKVLIRGVASQRLIRRGVRKLILARLLKRELLRKQARRPAQTAPAPETSH